MTRKPDAPPAPSPRPSLIALAPCPFCGGSARIEIGAAAVWATCVADDCGASSMVNGKTEITEVARRWNRRAHAAATAPAGHDPICTRCGRWLPGERVVDGQAARASANDCRCASDRARDGAACEHGVPYSEGCGDCGFDDSPAPTARGPLLARCYASHASEALSELRCRREDGHKGKHEDGVFHWGDVPPAPPLESTALTALLNQPGDSDAREQAAAPGCADGPAEAASLGQIPEWAIDDVARLTLGELAPTMEALQHMRALKAHERRATTARIVSRLRNLPRPVLVGPVMSRSTWEQLMEGCARIIENRESGGEGTRRG